ncbi:hypothetical protein MHF_0711 [Mycoplasma haemofelis Ohio2]|uniref:Uncharacterized protein n=1 Tax=Mycoplasma haemofelis (strain Ohio2) TaxID=859194 RepID=F6FID3_MYCHI|nr:hypothetical protein MHF_0711 [Mycoplasma haemofelis Ohio2]
MATTLTLPQMGLAFLGAMGASGLGLLIKSQIFDEPIVVKFKNKYSQALLDLSSTEGDGFTKTESKWTSFKGSQGTPKNSLLAEAKTLSTSDETNSKKKYREGCRSIYDSKFVSEGDAWDDFKAYCSKTNGDAWGSEKWINDAITGSSVASPWKERLDALKSKVSILPKALSDLKAAIGSTTYSTQHATTLKTWCDSEKNSPFEGSDSHTYKYLGEFCRTA